VILRRMIMRGVYTKLADAVRAVKNEYQHDMSTMARAIVEYRGQVLFLLFAACSGWGVAIWKCLERGV